MCVYVCVCVFVFVLLSSSARRGDAGVEGVNGGILLSAPGTDIPVEMAVDFLPKKLKYIFSPSILRPVHKQESQPRTIIINHCYI